VDGGSKDHTAIIAQKEGARVIQKIANPQCGGGRGGQIYTGLKDAKGDIIAVVHADMQIPAPMFQQMVDLLQMQPMVAGGAIGSQFDENGWRFRLLEFANDLRAVLIGISFGDQVQFFRRRPVFESNSFPDIPLMEDVEFSLRLKRLGRPVYLFGNAQVSARKWKKRGFGHAWTVIYFFSSYLFKRLWRKPDTATMFRKYYAD
jgi:glycosyltransferase involved in cell wall biosynthesis